MKGLNKNVECKLTIQYTCDCEKEKQNMCPARHVLVLAKMRKAELVFLIQDCEVHLYKYSLMCSEKYLYRLSPYY